ncbi:OprD family outer membrane porin [Campylobacter sp. RM9328]|uniref:OprD family outer membrane porin n=1 Tax=Campylobacter sp. RM9328 TaxID=1705720 RepID=UPI001474ED6A|nr:OprD family outer membrane porin [Campylobacter sp. RM9328]
MKLGKLSLVAAVALGCLASANAADNLAEALSNGKLSATLKATYADHTEKEGTADQNNENIFGVGVELGYVTDSLYGFRIGLTGQGWGSPFHVENKSKSMYNKEWWANGFVLSEAYLGYAVGKTDIKAGRQYVVTPLVAGNYTRAFKEAFEGVTITNKDIPDTSLWAGWFYKFQGRSSVAMGSKIDAGKTHANDTTGRAPVFKDRVILGNLTGPNTVKFDDIYSASIVNKSLPGLTLTGAYAAVTDVELYPTTVAKNGDIDLYLAEANYVLPVADLLKLKFDLQWKGSRADGSLDAANVNLDGDMLGVRVGVSDFYGFGASYAYTTVSDDDAVILGVGNGPGSYTAMPIRGPFVYTGFAGMDTHKFILNYDFSTIGVKGLKTALHYVTGEQDRLSKNTHGGNAFGKTAGEAAEIDGWAIQASYDIPSVKGLQASVTYTDLDRKATNVLGNKAHDFGDKEFWLQLSYKFNILN